MSYLKNAMIETSNNPDWSTIDLQILRKLPVYRLPRTYSLSADPGCGCARDPPGYPTYFLRGVFGRTGMILDSAKQWVILYSGVAYVAVPKPVSAGWKDQLRRFWKPLPMDHPRTIAWMQGSYAYLGRYIFDEKSL
jgi:hypothetical protein